MQEFARDDKIVAQVAATAFHSLFCIHYFAFFIIFLRRLIAWIASDG